MYYQSIDINADVTRALFLKLDFHGKGNYFFKVSTTQNKSLNHIPAEEIITTTITDAICSCCACLSYLDKVYDSVLVQEKIVFTCKAASQYERVSASSDEAFLINHFVPSHLVRTAGRDLLYKTLLQDKLEKE